VSALRVRAYNVRFGDALLVSIPERDGGREVTRHMLIDMGNVLSSEGGDDSVFEPVMRDILEVLDGAPLSLYVMTHEHLDHVQGLLYASDKLGLKLPGVERAWITPSAEPGYYDSHPEAKRSLELASARYLAARRHFNALEGSEEVPPSVRAMLANNDALLADGGSSKTQACVDFLATLTPQTSYVHVGHGHSAPHPFVEATLHIWGPEEDTAAYYGRFDAARLQPLPSSEGREAPPLPPPGVDAGAFYNLVNARKRGYFDNLLAIDKAANDTSVVICIEWHGWRLLFPGDAEERAWRTMDARGLLEPVHFYKVGHHGSHNGTPEADILDKILPVSPPDARPRRAVVSTCENTYNNVPDEATLEGLRKRCEVTSTLGLKDGAYIDFEFEA